MLSKTETDKIRGHLLVAGWPPSRIADHFEVRLQSIHSVICGDSVSERIQRFIQDQIGYWPWERQPGEPKRAS